MKSIRALLILGIFISLVGGGGGAALLILGYGHDTITQPLWKTGQYWMFQGLINLAIFVALFIMMKKSNKLVQPTSLRSAADE